MLPTRMLALLSTLLLPAQLTFPLYIDAVLPVEPPFATEP